MNRTLQKPLLYLITDRQELGRIRPATQIDSGLDSLLEFIDSAVDAGVDLIQIRERDLPACSLYRLTESALRAASGTATRILVNDRADIAAALGAGVHLTTRSIDTHTVRRVFGQDLLIGVSTHNSAELAAAQQGGADFVVFGPVFETRSKLQYGAPVGVENLRMAVKHARIPVLGLGGIAVSNAKEIFESGAAGIAGISLFIESRDLTRSVRELKSLAKS